MTALNKQALREQIESAADAYWQFDNGWISDMKCGDLSHEYLLFVKEPKNVLALLDELDELEAAQSYAKERDEENQDLMLTVGRLRVEKEAAEKRIAELEARTVMLPQYRNSPDMHTKQFYEAIGFNQGLDIFIEALRAAGIGVKGE